MPLDHPRKLVAFGHSGLLPQTINPGYNPVNDNDGETNKRIKYNNNDEGGTLLSMLRRNFSFLFFRRNFGIRSRAPRLKTTSFRVCLKAWKERCMIPRGNIK